MLNHLGSGNSSLWLGFIEMRERGTQDTQTTASFTILLSENKEKNKAIKL